MRDDLDVDRLLKDAMRGPVPALSRDFDARVMRAVRPRRLTATGRAVLGGYAVAAAGTTIWAMQGLPASAVAIALTASAAVAMAGRAYGRRLVQRG